LSASCSELEGSLEGLEDRVAAIQERLQAISRKYAEVRVDERELARKAKKEELITKLKQLYGDEVVCIKSSHATRLNGRKDLRIIFSMDG
jgi:hypothetical protein